jgi:hypothetical protein
LTLNYETDINDNKADLLAEDQMFDLQFVGEGATIGRMSFITM